MSLTKIAAAFGSIRRRPVAFLAFPLAATVIPSYSSVRLVAEAYLDDAAK